MKRIFKIILSLSIILLSCQKGHESTGHASTPIDNNLVCNPSFEMNGKASLECWHVVKDFTTFPDTFSTEVPANGGQFSLRIEGIKDVQWDPYAESYVTGISGQKIITLSAYILSLYGGQPVYLRLEQVRNGQMISSKSDVDWAFNGWKKFSLTDTFSLQMQDSLRIKIIQTTGQNSGAYLDLVELTSN